MAEAIQAGHHHTVFPAGEIYADTRALLAQIKAMSTHVPLIAGLPAADIETLVRYMQAWRVPPHCELIREGAPGDCMLLIVEGSVEIIKQGKNGLPQRIALVGAGDTLGEMSLIDGEPRFASCMSLEPSLLAVLDRRALDDIMSQQPQLGIRLLHELLRLLNQRLRDTGAQLVSALEQH